MRLRYASIMALTLVSLCYAGCMSQFVKSPANEPVAPEIVTSIDNTPSAAMPSNQMPDTLVSEIPADATIYGKEEATLSSILNLYEEAENALDNGDYSLAETHIDRAAVLSASIDIASIGDESLALRYMNTLASIFQDYGRLFRDVDQINREEPLNWLEQLSETKPEDFKNGRWTDDELMQIVRKIALRCDMPIEYNDRVKKSIHFFQTVERKTMEKWIHRSGIYMPIIKKILEEHDLPLDLAYLSMIESGFNPRAYSRTHNSGLWQFGSATGRMYGLKRTQWYDQRYDPLKSTKAAARYLNDLYKMYDDWLVVMAAYNYGPTRINRRIKAGSTDFWSMKLPQETRNYVPSFMAAVIISKAPELFGFEKIEKEAPLTFDTVEVPYTSLKKAAECAGVDLKTLKAINPELIKSHTPARQNYTLRIPTGTKEHFLTEYAKLPKEKYSPPEVDKYYVKRGDTLSGIAAKFRVSVNSLVTENGIRNRNRLRIGQKLSIPGRGASSGNSYPAIASKPITQAELTAAKKNTSTYTVRRNDSLWIIAVKHKTSVSMIQALNNMGKRTRIHPGRKLKIPARSETISVSSASQLAETSTKGNGEIIYIIKKRDTLYEIALKYNVSYRDIMRWNNIKNHRTIRPGQKIIIMTKKG
ncbi:LysM peptidoglycan-binding domain-containing protein [Thermodesulfobacteriota bacterium]